VGFGQSLLINRWSHPHC